MNKTIQNKKSKSKEYMEFWQQFKQPLNRIAKAKENENKLLQEILKEIKNKKRQEK